jgi:MFS family permease
MAIMQERFPDNRSFVNGLYLALLFLVNALAGVIMGWLSDALGTQQAFFWSIWICLLGVPFVFMLPKTK